jgi:ABC-type transport system involved in Fe-S cluster assembly fused permease/ATPase subunit
MGHGESVSLIAGKIEGGEKKRKNVARVQLKHTFFLVITVRFC